MPAVEKSQKLTKLSFRPSEAKIAILITKFDKLRLKKTPKNLKIFRCAGIKKYSFRGSKAEIAILITKLEKVEF